MIGDWFVVAPALAVTLLLVFLPGIVALRGVGLRGLALVAFAPVLSIAMIAVVALVLGVAHVPWNPVTLSISLAVLVAVAWVLGRVLGHPVGQKPMRPRLARWILPTAVGIGAVLGAWRLIAYIGDPAGISQTNDAVFHMNAVRFIIETANASSLHVSEVIGAHAFYPAAWHAFVSAVVEMAGAQIPVAANAFTLVIGAVIWPLGLAWFAHEVTGSARVAATTAVLSPALQMFPLLMIQWGVLFPNALSVALTPAAIAVVMRLPIWHAANRPVASWTRAMLLVAIAVAALALAQPAALPIWAAVCVVWCTDLTMRARRGGGLPQRLALVVSAWIALVVMWYVLSTGTGGSHWPPFRTKLEGLAEVLFNGQVRLPYAWAISLLMVVGLVVAAWTSTRRWLVAVWVGSSVLYMLVATVGNLWVRDVVLAPWYADPNRIAAFAPIVVIPLAALGLERVVAVAVERFAAEHHEQSSILTTLVVALLCVLLIVLLRPAQMPQFLNGRFDAESRYLTTTRSYLSIDERALLESLDEHVEPGARIIANPSTGAAFGYMFSGLDVYPRTWSPPSDRAWQVVSQDLRSVAAAPRVCDALDELGNPEYVLDFGPGEALPGRYVMPGMTGFARQQGFELVERKGTATLWRITACAR